MALPQVQPFSHFVQGMAKDLFFGTRCSSAYTCGNTACKALFKI